MPAFTYLHESWEFVKADFPKSDALPVANPDLLASKIIFPMFLENMLYV